MRKEIEEGGKENKKGENDGVDRRLCRKKKSNTCNNYGRKI